MDRNVVRKKPTAKGLVRLAFGVLILVVWSIAAARAQDAAPVNPPPAFSASATHLLGFEDAKGGAGGTLSIQDDALQFQKSGKPPVQVKIASVQDVFLGEQSKQVGGVPMTLGKAAVPFGGGRLVSLFAHKKYDTVTLEYVDSDGGSHGAIFQLEKGQGELLRTQLAAKGVHVSPQPDAAAKPKTAEAASESK